jgi:nucleotide-binding universal stress UspA family protein
MAHLEAEETKFGVCFDGSKLSQKALEYVTALVKRRGEAATTTVIKALHIAPRADRLDQVPDHLKPAKLADDIKHHGAESELQFDWMEEAREAGATTGEALCKLVAGANCEYVVAGSYGRKDPADEKHIGSTGSAPMRMMTSNVIVVKHSSALPTAEPMKWVVSSDDSDYSMKAIADTKALMSEGDTLTILFVTSGTVGMSKNGTAIDTFKLLKEKKYLQMCDEFKFILKAPGTAIDEIIMEYADAEAEAHVLVMAHKGLTYNYSMKQDAIEAPLGSVCTGVLRSSRLTVMITKGKIDAVKAGPYVPN